MAYSLENHIKGKVYDLTQENMQAMIRDIERMKDLLKDPRVIYSFNEVDWESEKERGHLYTGLLVNVKEIKSAMELLRGSN